MAVLPFETTTALPIESKHVTERLRDELVRTGKFSALDDTEVEQAMKELGLDISGCIVGQCASQIGKTLGVRRVVTGSLSVRDSTHWVVSGFLVDADKGETLKTSTVESEDGSLSFIGDAMAVVAARIAGVPPPTALLAQGQLSEIPIGKPEEPKAEHQAESKAEDRAGPKRGFGVFTGYSSHSGRIQTSQGQSFSYAFGGIAFGLDYQWVAPIFSNAGTSTLSLFFMTSGGSDLGGHLGGDLASYYDNGDASAFGVEVRYWMGDTYVGGHIGQYAQNFAGHANGPRNSPLGVDGPGAGLVAGHEWAEGWFVGGSIDYMKGQPQREGVEPYGTHHTVASKTPNDPAPVTWDGYVEDHGLWLTVGYRWK